MCKGTVSVIIPIYNVEKYLSACVDSVLGQTYQALQIILVDDGSTDASGGICDGYTGKDPRIQVIHKENGGLSDARNCGLLSASGKYITFFDSDDWVERDTLMIAYNQMSEQTADLIIWGYAADFVDDQEQVQARRDNAVLGICDKNGDTSVLIQKNALGISGYAWNKLYRTDIIKENGILFEKGISMVEDILFNSLYFCQCEKIKFIDYIGTHYIQRNRVTLGNKRYDNVWELKLAACAARENILKHFNMATKQVERIMSHFYFTALESAVFNIVNEKEVSRRTKLGRLDEFLASEKAREVRGRIKALPLKKRLSMLMINLRMVNLLMMFHK